MVKLLQSTFSFQTPLRKETTLCIGHFKEQGLKLSLLEYREFAYIIWNYLAQKICLFSLMYFFICRIIYLSKGFQPSRTLIFISLLCLIIDNLQLFDLVLAPMVCLHQCQYFFFHQKISTQVFSGTSRCSRFIFLYFQTQSWNQPFIQELWFILFKNSIRKQVIPAKLYNFY